MKESAPGVVQTSASSAPESWPPPGKLRETLTTPPAATCVRVTVPEVAFSLAGATVVLHCASYERTRPEVSKEPPADEGWPVPTAYVVGTTAPLPFAMTARMSERSPARSTPARVVGAEARARLERDDDALDDPARPDDDGRGVGRRD